MLTEHELKNYIKKGLLVKNLIDQEKQVQQCGVDLSVGKMFTLEGKGVIDFSNEKRKLPEYAEIYPKDGVWHLEPGLYHASMNETIVLPKDVAGLLLPRSSALTCGIEVHTAVWDPGYEGRSFIHVSLSKEIEMHKNARIAQMIFFKLEKETKGYKGVYNKEDVLKFAKRGNNDN
jgi:dUTP pyrophosphatase